MLHSLHYDIVFYPPGHWRHPEASSKSFVFAALTTKGLEHLKASPYGDWSGGKLIVSDENDASDVMDHATDLPVYAYE